MYIFAGENGKRRRFKPWDNLRRMFQRKNSRDDAATTTGGSAACLATTPTTPHDAAPTKLFSGMFGMGSALRSRSTSELLVTQAQTIPG